MGTPVHSYGGQTRSCDGREGLLVQSSSASRFTAGALAFFILSQSDERPDRYSGVLPLRHDTFKAELAGMPKHGLAVALHVLVESNAWPGLGQDHLKRGLATLQRIKSEIVAVQLDQIESV